MCKDKIYKIISKINLKIVNFFVLAIYVMIVILSYRNQILKIKDKYVNTYINDMMEETNYRIQLKIKEKFRFLENIASCMGGSEISEEDMLNVLNNNEETSFAYMIYNNGKIVGDKDRARGYENEMYYDVASAGERAISALSESEGEEYLVFAVPVCKGEYIFATLQCGYSISVFSDLVEKSAFNKKVSTFVSQSDGTLITRPDSIGDTNNLFELLNNTTSSTEKTLEKLQTKLENGDSGIMVYKSGKNKIYICYSYLSECDWYSVSIVSENSIDPQTNKIITQNIMLSTQIISGFVIYILFIVAYDMFLKKYIENMLKADK